VHSPWRDYSTLLAKSTGFPRGLGTTHSYPIAVDMKPFSSVGLQAHTLHLNNCTTTKICTEGCFMQDRSHTLCHKPPRAPPTCPAPKREIVAIRRGPAAKSRSLHSGHLSAIHFRGQSIRQVSCYTLLGGCRLPWPPSCCLDESTPFMGSGKCSR